MSGGAKNCAQLRAEQPRLFQAQTHGTQPQGRVGGQGRAGPGSVHLLVGAEIQRADRYRRSLPGAYNFDICLILLLLVRRLLAIHEQVLRPIETDPLGAYLNGGIQIRGQLDVCLQNNGFTIGGYGRRVPQLTPRHVYALNLTLQLLIVANHLLVGIDEHHALTTIDDEQVVLAQV